VIVFSKTMPSFGMGAQADAQTFSMADQSSGEMAAFPIREDNSLPRISVQPDSAWQYQDLIEV
jgi:hypothetical protein